MAVSREPSGSTTSRGDGRDRPAISICRGRPGTAVALEAGNTDGWIASDVVVEVPE